jgi:cbb3-type cytochrome oxidase subunit 3
MTDAQSWWLSAIVVGVCLGGVFHALWRIAKHGFARVHGVRDGLE